MTYQDQDPILLLAGATKFGYQQLAATGEQGAFMVCGQSSHGMYNSQSCSMLQFLKLLLKLSQQKHMTRSRSTFRG